LRDLKETKTANVQEASVSFLPHIYPTSTGRGGGGGIS
jgi:hypothetical protein